MKVLFLNWRDIKNPQAGVAEVVTHELAKALVERGDQVDFFAASFPGALDHERIDGISVFRGGGRYLVPWHAYKFYQRSKPYDLVIDECNTNQFFTFLYIPRRKRLFFIHQLTRLIWFYQLVFPLSLIGYLLEPILIFSHRKSLAVTVSKSTMSGLIKFGMKKENIHIIPEGLDSKPLEYLPPLSQKKGTLSLVYVGRLVKYKRVHEAIRAVEVLKKKYPQIKLDIIGNGQAGYVDYLKNLVSEFHLEKNVNFLGRLSRERRNTLMSQAWCILVTSVLEGWGLIVTEANAVGTPACVYDVGGLRDSVKHNQTGLVVPDQRPELLASAVWSLWRNPGKYQQLRQSAWQWSKVMTFAKMRQAFLHIIDKNYK